MEECELAGGNIDKGHKFSGECKTMHAHACVMAHSWDTEAVGWPFSS